MWSDLRKETRCARASHHVSRYVHRTFTLGGLPEGVRGVGAGEEGARAMPLLIVGCEHSGTRWVSHLIALHPDIHTIEHWSVPHAGWIPTHDLVEKIMAGRIRRVVLVYRDASCTRESQRHSGSFSMALDHYAAHPDDSGHEFLQGELVETWNSSANALVAACERAGYPWALVSYEQLLQSRRLGLVQVFRMLGIDPDDYQYYDQDDSDRSQFIVEDPPLPYSSAARDGNEKYVATSVRSATRLWVIQVSRHLPVSVRGLMPRSMRSRLLRR